MKVKFMLSSLSSLFIFFLCLYLLMLGDMSNVMAYICSVIISTALFVIIFLISNLFFKGEIDIKFRFAEKSIGIWFPLLITIAIGIMAYVIDYNTKEMLGRYIFWDIRSYVLACVVLIFSWLLKKKINKKRIFYVLVICCIFLCAWIGYKPNVWGDTFNFEAYWLNVAQICDHVPYDDGLLSFYGHYALFYLPFFKVFGFNAITVALTQVLENIIICCSILYCIKKVTGHRMIQICGVMGIIYYVGNAFHYPQGLPHRLLFLSIMLALGCRMLCAEKKILVIGWGYITTFFSIIWNTETGIVLLVAWSVLTFMYFYLFENGRMRILLCLLSIVLIPVIFLLSWESVSVVNIVVLKGDALSLEEYLFPLQNGNFAQALAHDVEFCFSTWMLVMGILFLFLFRGIKNIFQNRKDRDAVLTTYIASIGLMNNTYFFNRAAWGNLRLVAYYPVLILVLYSMNVLISEDSIPHSFVANKPGEVRTDTPLLAVGSFIKRYDNKIKNQTKLGIVGGCVYCFILGFSIVLLNFPQTYAAMKKYQDTASMKEFFAGLDEEIPINTKSLCYETSFF